MSRASATQEETKRFAISSAEAQSEVADAINALYLSDETELVKDLLQRATLTDDARLRIRDRAHGLVEAVRKNRSNKGGLDAFLKKYDLTSHEGVVLMCLAEALLRIPDADTADRLIADKLAAGNWKEHMGTSDSLFVNASTWGLMLTGKLIKPESEVLENPTGYLARIAGRLGEPVVRTAMRQAMKIMGHQFVMGRDIGEAIRRSNKEDNRRYRHSFDMLGEAALTMDDATGYFDAYRDAISAIGASAPSGTSINDAPSISVKLSALFPRYEYAQRDRVLVELTPLLLALAEHAAAAGIQLTVDAEEADRLEIAMEVFARVYRSESLAGWHGLGLALQAYQKRARPQLSWLTDMARAVGRRIPLRLVKGAYWDTEIKRGQEDGLEGYPVFTRKQNTDVSYLACARDLLDARDVIYPQFATHNAHTVAAIIEMAGSTVADFEFQRLHGMGEELYEEIVGAKKYGLPCRVYAPVGRHEDLLPYLVRRLLENGANSSFVNRIQDERAPIDEIVADPLEFVRALDKIPHPGIPLPTHIYGEERRNSQGINLADYEVQQRLATQLAEQSGKSWTAAPVINGKAQGGEWRKVSNPSDRRDVVGRVCDASGDQVTSAIGSACNAQPAWDQTPAGRRAEILLRAADLFEENRNELLAICVREAGKTIPDCISELREAVDFLRYYAAQARREFSDSQVLPGPTGESNELLLGGRGVFVCISPWNFPLAIFTGQVAAALAAGNAVVAKPAEQTSIVAARAVQLLHEAGIPVEVLQFVPGDGASVGAAAVADPRIAGVAFTGSTDTAHRINRALASRDGTIATLIAETGGQNAMIVDSSALPEQVVLDVVQSAFNSAGQRCSALRVLCLQEEIAPRVIELLSGHMRELVVGDPALLSTDTGPVIDADAQQVLQAHISRIKQLGTEIAHCPIPTSCQNGSYVTPIAVEIPSLDVLDKEVFGPVLHVLRFASSKLDALIESINQTGYGLTLGIHSRIDGVARQVAARARVGNVYINRNMVGAVVGVQPFGGRRLSGTGPKAGGPHYLHRFATEKTITTNTAAVGGNASLLSLGSD